MAFHFYTERRLVELTGDKAGNLVELLTHMRNVSGSSIFYHTHQRYLTQHFRKPTFYSDFAEWISRALQEEALAEKLAMIEPLQFTTIRELREAMIRNVEMYVNDNGTRERKCPPGDEFHFCKSKSFIMPTGLVAEDLRDFVTKLPHLTNTSTYFHFFEARLRLERPTNDFSQWLADCGEVELAAQINGIDPYIMTLEELRQQIFVLCSRRLMQR
jgi:hypothetical protein